VLSLWVSPEAPLSIHTIQVLVSIEKLGYSFGFVGNMLYMMQQLAPGRFKMTHYAFGTALMNLVLVPTQMVSGPLADWLGYRGFFALVLLASVPSIWAAWRAPFPRNCDPEGGTA
jgi:PAT family beta-lactamase induction signal transducer AmpG